MADAKRCDVCSTHYDPATQGTRLQNTEVGREDDVHDICTPRCLLALAQRRCPASTVTLSSNGDDISSTVQKLSLTMDVVEADHDWMPSHLTAVEADLFQQAQVMVEELVSLVLRVTEPEPEGEST